MTKPQLEFGSDKFPIIAGPCVIENESDTLKLAEHIASLAAVK